jgi:hypothetical protein
MRHTVRPTRENRTSTVDFRDEATYFRLLGDGKALLECVLAFRLSLGFQLTHKATCRGGGGLTRHSHYVRVRLGGGAPSGVSRAPQAKQSSPACRTSSYATARCARRWLATPWWPPTAGSVWNGGR